MKLDFGKNKGKAIKECNTSYLKWLVAHEKQLKLSNRWSARDAKFELARREQPVSKYPVNRYGISDISLAGSLNGTSQGFSLFA